MKKDKNMKSYTAAELKAGRAKSRTDLSKVDATTDAELVLPHAKQSVHLRLEKEIISYFKSQGKGHISRMQAVLKAYVEAHRSQGK